MNNSLDNKILLSFGIDKPVLLGKGIQSNTYEYNTEEVIRIIEGTNTKYISKLKDFYDKVNAKSDTSFDLPNIKSVVEKEGKVIVVEKKLLGERADRIIAPLNNKDKKIALKNYIDAILEIKKIDFDSSIFGEMLIGDREPITDSTWKGFLKKRVSESYRKSLDYLDVDLPNHKVSFDKYINYLDNFEFKDTNSLVHGDYYFENIFMDEKFKVTAVFDFSALTVFGDWRMDLGGALDFMLSYDFIDEEDEKYTIDYINQITEEPINDSLLLYKIFYAFRFSDTKESDSKIYNWSIQNLNNLEKLI